MSDPNQIHKSNCKIIVETLHQLKEASLVKIINQISKDQKVKLLKYFLLKKSKNNFFLVPKFSWTKNY